MLTTFQDRLTVGRMSRLHAERRVDLPLHRIAQARSGDKNDTSDISVFFASAALFEHCAPQLSADRVREFMTPLVHGPVERYTMPKLHALKFVCHGALGGGGSASLRSDNLGKAMASALLRMTISGVPVDAAEESPTFAGPPRKESR